MSSLLESKFYFLQISYFVQLSTFDLLYIDTHRKTKYFYKGRLDWDERSSSARYVKDNCKPLRVGVAKFLLFSPTPLPSSPPPPPPPPPPPSSPFDLNSPWARVLTHLLFAPPPPPPPPKKKMHRSPFPQTTSDTIFDTTLRTKTDLPRTGSKFA